MLGDPSWIIDRKPVPVCRARQIMLTAAERHREGCHLSATAASPRWRNTAEIGRQELPDRADRRTGRSRRATSRGVRRRTHPGRGQHPPDELANRIAELPDGTEVLAYCRGRFRMVAHDAVRLLTAGGRTARRLQDGLLEWRLAGLPVAT